VSATLAIVLYIAGMVAAAALVWAGARRVPDAAGPVAIGAASMLALLLVVWWILLAQATPGNANCPDSGSFAANDATRLMVAAHVLAVIAIGAGAAARRRRRKPALVAALVAVVAVPAAAVTVLGIGLCE
jgi:hypothetical protein